MRYHLLLVGVMLVSVACGGPSPSPTPAPTPAALVPLPAGLSGIPGPADTTAEISAVSPADELQVGDERDYELGHCGLGSPIDIDGSLWDPLGTKFVLTEAQSGELVNATRVAIALVSEDSMTLTTPAGAELTLARHEGPRRYFLCD